MADNGSENGTVTHAGHPDDVLALALAGGASLRDAAGTARMGERTAYRRWADADFRQRVALLRSRMVGQALGTLADAMTEAASTRRALLKAQTESVRLGACRTLLEMGLKVREMIELETRMSGDLEKKFPYRAQEGNFASGQKRD